MEIPQDIINKVNLLKIKVGKDGNKFIRGKAVSISDFAIIANKELGISLPYASYINRIIRVSRIVRSVRECLVDVLVYNCMIKEGLVERNRHRPWIIQGNRLINASDFVKFGICIYEANDRIRRFLANDLCMDDLFLKRIKVDYVIKKEGVEYLKVDRHNGPGNEEWAKLGWEETEEQKDRLDRMSSPTEQEIEAWG